MTQSVTVPMAMSGTRLDAALAILFPDHSRNRLKAWLDDGHILVDGAVWAGKQRLEGNETITATLPEATQETDAQPEDIPLEIIFEDEHLIIINKPPGLVVHPGAGNREGTLLNALLHHAPELANVARAGIVHRLDKDTSGVMMVARTPQAQTHLVRQLQTHAASREYVALVHGAVRKSGTVEGAIGRHGRDRTKMAMVVVGGKPAVTHYKLRESFGGAAMLGKNYSLLECKLETGRTHQIRVHLASIKHPLVGDATYGKRGDSIFHRQALHAWRLTLAHPATGETVRFIAPMAKDMKHLLKELRAQRDNRTLDDGFDDDEDFDDDGVEVIYVRD